MVDSRRETAAGDDGDDVDWRSLMKELQTGREISLPVTDDRDLEKKQRQLGRRAERRGLALNMTPGDGVLRIRKTGDVPIDAQTAAAGAERRAQRRAERGAAE